MARLLTDFEAALPTLSKAVFSQPIDKTDDQKVNIRPVMLKGTLAYQLERFRDNKAFHRNVSAEELLKVVANELESRYRQALVVTDTETIQYSMKRDGSYKRHATASVPLPGKVQSHNREKEYILKEGENIVGFAQSLCDLDYAINALHSAKEYGDAKYTVIGHSWGGFAALNISALHPEVESCVSISGFIGVERMIEQFFSGILKFYRPSVLRLEHESNPMYSLIDARKSLKNTKSRILYIASDNDPTVKTAYHFDTLKRSLPEVENIDFLLVEGKLHNPNYSENAVAELSKMTKAMTEGMKKKSFETPKAVEAFRTSWDWEKITEQDEELWSKIFNFIEGGSK